MGWGVRVTRLDDRFVIFSDRQAVILASLVMKTLRQRYEVNRDPVIAEIMDDLAIVGNAFLDRRANATRSARERDSVTSSRPMETTATAAKRLGIRPATVRRALEEGRLAGEMVDGRWQVDPTSTYVPAQRRRPASGFDAAALLGGIREVIATDPELQGDIDAALDALASSGTRFALAAELDAARGFAPTPGTHGSTDAVIPGEFDASVPSHGSEDRS